MNLRQLNALIDQLIQDMPFLGDLEVSIDTRSDAGPIEGIALSRITTEVTVALAADIDGFFKENIVCRF